MDRLMEVAAQLVVCFIVFGAILGFAMLLWAAFGGLRLAGRSAVQWREHQRQLDREALAARQVLSDLGPSRN